MIDRGARGVLDRGVWGVIDRGARGVIDKGAWDRRRRVSDNTDRVTNIFGIPKVSVPLLSLAFETVIHDRSLIMQTGCSNCLCIPACTHQHFIRTYAYNAHTYICRHIRALMHTYIHVCIRMYHINTYIPECIIFIRTRSIDSYIYAQGTSQIYIQCTCAFVCTCVHTCIDMYIHTVHTFTWSYALHSSRILVLDFGQLKEFDSPSALVSNKNTIFYSMAKDAGLAEWFAEWWWWPYLVPRYRRSLLLLICRVCCQLNIAGSWTGCDICSARSVIMRTLF